MVQSSNFHNNDEADEES